MLAELIVHVRASAQQKGLGFRVGIPIIRLQSLHILRVPKLPCFWVAVKELISVMTKTHV